ncbi:hypothetical protein CAPTEDRAFT_212444, partial [Capitella teleta]
MSDLDKKWTVKSAKNPPKEWQGKFLRLDPKTKQIRPVEPHEIKVEDKSKRRATLHIYDLEGDPKEVLVDSKWSTGGPQGKTHTAAVTRETYKTFIESIGQDHDL